ncbi:MAG TPA: carbamoyltransferase [Phycisphaerae bacterium]|nr:carbamoyltransferase [Phycisphaerae bacterium]
MLGISAFYHDSAAALVRDGRVVAAAQEERFTRVKHDNRFPARAVEYCLAEAGLEAAGLDAVVFYEKPLLKFERLLETYLAFAPSGFLPFLRAMPSWLRRKLFLPREIDQGLGGAYAGPILFARHHESHAASAFFPSPFEEAAIITADGVGEWSTTTWGVGCGNRVELKQELRFPHSLGLLYSAFTYYTGFKVNSGEYKLMGLAPYGEPRYADLILEKLIELKDDGSFRLDQRFFGYCDGLRMTNRSFHRLFGGPPREPEAPLTRREMDLAASVQQVTEQVILRMARYVHGRTGLTDLCLAGGVALNCVANGHLLREGPFSRLWIQPAAGDAGGALGAALHAWHHTLGRPRVAAAPDAQEGSYLGPAVSDADIAARLDALGAVHGRLADGALFERVAELLDAGQVVGLFQGRMEFGPRALGSRSILGDARSPETQTVMNLKIKFRESFRPFAPSVLEERAGEYFDLPVPSPYMLLVGRVGRGRLREIPPEQAALHGLDRLRVVRSDIPAVTHVDGSARVQTVSRETAPRYHALIEAFRERTGCAVVVNTSFNVRGEPIVCTPEDAYRCFMSTGMDALVLENRLCLKPDQPPLPGAEHHRAGFAPD